MHVSVSPLGRIAGKRNPPGRWWVNKPCNWPKGINDHSGDYLASRDVVHEHKTCINKKRLGEDAENSINL
jgi:hypothetical protein